MTTAWGSSPMIGDHLGVNELHGSRYWSLVQLTGLLRSYEVSAGQSGCCTHLLYHSLALLNFGISESRARASWCMELARLHTTVAQVVATALNYDGREPRCIDVESHKPNG
jgi:hypothetical protein